jgi:hypothetical protein
MTRLDQPDVRVVATEVAVTWQACAYSRMTFAVGVGSFLLIRKYQRDSDRTNGCHEVHYR